MLVLLWTDVLIFALVALTLLLWWVSRRREHLRAPWRQVCRSRVAVASAVVLAVYVTIGLLDSIHFHPRLDEPDAQQGARYSTEVISLFDQIAGRMRTQVEKTYSAPFAAYLYAKEVIDLPGGRQRRDYPRLEYGGRLLRDPERDRAADIASNVAGASRDALFFWLLLVATIVAMLARRDRSTVRTALLSVVFDRRPTPWRVVLGTAAVLLLLGAICARLGVQYHILGTDKVGQDVLYQAFKSIRTGLVIGTLTTLVMLPIACLLGIMAGYFRGWVDDVIQYIYTTLSSIPGVLLIAAAILTLQVYMATHAQHFTSVAVRADMRLLFLCIILGTTSWTGLCRLLRGEALKLRELEYIQAARALGVRHSRIILRHLLPNVMHIVLISVVLDFSSLVLAEAVLSYINIGVDPTTMSWGNMINSARLEMAREPIVWWSLTAAFILMFVLVLSANLFADAIRDAFDPRLRGERT